MLTVKAGKTDDIIFPGKLISKSGMKEGEKVKIDVRKGTLIVTKETDDFFALEGALKDTDIDKRIKALDKDWDKWKTPESL